MAYMVSKYYGVPASLPTAKKQFAELKEKERKFQHGKFLVLKTQKSGMYKGLPVNYIYDHKPKGEFIKIHKLR